MSLKMLNKVMKNRSGPDLRELFTERIFKPIIEEVFKRRPDVKEIQLCFAQYWDDEAHDAVHDLYVLSNKTDLTWTQLFNPRTNKLACEDIYVLMREVENSLFNDHMYYDNNQFITAFACYTHDAGSQENDAVENYSPYLIARRTVTGTEYTVCPMVRPELDGVKPEYGDDEE